MNLGQSSYYYGNKDSTDDNGNGGSVDSLFGTQSANGSNGLTPTHPNDQQVISDETQLGPGPIGLKLTVTPALIQLTEKEINKIEITHINSNNNNNNIKKLKASSIYASLIEIGRWKRVARNEGDVVAKCYFARKRLVWEILEGGLKKKMEIKWSDISAIRALLVETKPGILQIQIRRPPSFYEEPEMQPKKHTVWREAEDFTDGQASIFRLHGLLFPPGRLDEFYKQLLQHDQGLYFLSQQPFPIMLESPIFISSQDQRNQHFTSNHSSHRPTFQFQPTAIPSSLIASQHVQATPTSLNPSVTTRYVQAMPGLNYCQCCSCNKTIRRPN